jgi:glutamate N-acetyltransferase/amino-acid N-acetyltransferase
MKVRVRRTRLRVPGFRFAGVRCGLKESGKRDVALIASDVPATAAAAFTTNRVKAAPVRVGIEHAAAGRLQAIVINSGNANAYTGRQGLRVAREMCALVGRELGIDPKLVLPSSTGRIAVQVPLERVRRGVADACRALSRDGFHIALEGMMTTDAFPKFAVETLIVGGREVTVAGMAKGAGMIAPQMVVAPSGKLERHATLLSYILTDAAVALPAVRKALKVALAQSFNTIVVDGDTSTNDTTVLIANGVAGNRPLTVGSKDFAAFCGAATRVMTALARMVVKDGEGATKVVDIHVRRARSVREAERVADAIARSPLCKAAFFGGDPYAGRLVCAMGYSGARFDPQKIDIYLEGLPVVRRGVEVVDGNAELAGSLMQRAEIALTIDLKAGNAVAHRVCSDLTVDYVRFNSDYRT